MARSITREEANRTRPLPHEIERGYTKEKSFTYVQPNKVVGLTAHARKFYNITTHTHTHTHTLPIHYYYTVCSVGPQVPRQCPPKNLFVVAIKISNDISFRLAADLYTGTCSIR